jgi:hypothetical protein
LADDFAYKTTHLANMKVSLCIALGLTALGETELGMKGITKAARNICLSGKGNGRNPDDLSKELEHAINNVLIQRKSVWRCGRQRPLSARRRSGRGWEVQEVERSFWDWLDEPENACGVRSVAQGTE